MTPRVCRECGETTPLDPVVPPQLCRLRDLRAIAETARVKGEDEARARAAERILALQRADDESDAGWRKANDDAAAKKPSGTS